MLRVKSLCKKKNFIKNILYKITNILIVSPDSICLKKEGCPESYKKPQYIIIVINNHVIITCVLIKLYVNIQIK